MQGPGWSALGDGYYMALRVRGSPPTDIWFAYSVRFGRDALTSRTGDFFLFASRNTMATQQHALVITTHFGLALLSNPAQLAVFLPAAGANSGSVAA